MPDLKKIIFFSFIFFIGFIESLNADDREDSQTLFNLATTPFVNDGKCSVFFTYSFNQGSPSSIIDEWQIPDNNNILFNEYKAGISIDGRFSFFYEKTIGKKLEFNSSYIGTKNTSTINYFGLKYKIYKSENYYPDYSIGLNSIMDLPSIDFMVGSMRERIKYYVYVAIGFFYYIPFPNKYAAGISYEFVNDFNLFFEFQPVGDSDDQFNAILFGLSYNAFQYMSIHGSLF